MNENVWKIIFIAGEKVGSRSGGVFAIYCTCRINLQSGLEICSEGIINIIDSKPLSLRDVGQKLFPKMHIYTPTPPPPRLSDVSVPGVSEICVGKIMRSDML